MKMKRAKWIIAVVSLDLCLTSHFYLILNAQGNSDDQIEAIFADINKQMLNYFRFNGALTIYLENRYDSDSSVHLVSASGNEFYSEQLEGLVPGITSDHQVIFLSIGNESKQTIPLEPLPGNVVLITQDRKAVPAIDLMKLQRGQPLHKELNSFAKRYPEYIGGLRKQPILPGEYSMCMYIFSAPTAPYQLVIRDWLLQDIVIKQHFLERLQASP